jgi:DnaJ-class molecular chaperone
MPGPLPSADPTAHGDDHYEALGVTASATDAEIKQAFRALVRDLHPDRHPQEWGPLQRARAAQQWQRALSAWEALGDEVSRAAYDERLRALGTQRARSAAEERAAADLRAEFERAGLARRERDAAGPRPGAGPAPARGVCDPPPPEAA